MSRFPIAFVVTLLVLPATSSAATINYLGTGKGTVVEITSPSLGDLSVRAGELRWSADPQNELALLFYAYCVDPNHWLNTSQIVAVRPSAELETPGVENGSGKAAWLVNNYAPSIHEAGTDIDAAALQIAVWGAMFNSSGNLTDGPFRLNSTGPVATIAQSMLDSVFAATSNTANTAWLDAANGQDQMIPTPEPGTFLLMATGLAAAFKAARRRKY